MLRALPMFGALPIVVIEDLVDSLDENSFEAGATVVAEGDLGNEYHLITSGEVAVHVAVSDGERWAQEMASARSRCCATCHARLLSPHRPR